MNIAFANTKGGGAETSVRTTARWLADQGHTVHIIFTGKLPPWENESPNIHLHTISNGSLAYYVSKAGFKKTFLPRMVEQYTYNLNLSRCLHKLKEQNGLELVELLESGAFPRLYKGIPFIVKLHGSDWTFNHYCEDKPYYHFLIKNERSMLLAAARVLSPSRSLADFIAGACDVPRRIIKVIPNSIDTTRFQPAPPPDNGPPFRIMMVGRLEERKGTHIAVRALWQVWEHEPDTHLHLYGSNGGFGKEQIETEIPPDVHKGRIHFEGFVTWEELIERYQQAHFILAPTRYDNFPLMLLEAMACGRPVIASDVGGVPDLVQHQHNGWLVPRDDVDTLAQTILEAIRNPELREKYGLAAREGVEKFSVDNVMKRQILLYEQALQKPTR